MSLRDQLLAKGLVNKKDARRVERELKDERKAQQGARDAKSKRDAEERERVQAEARAQQEERAAARRAADAERERHERQARIRDIIAGNRRKNVGTHPFWFKSLDGRTALRLSVHRSTAEALRDGQLAIAALDGAYVLISRSGAEKLAELAPEVLVHFAQGPVEPGDGVYDRDWEPSTPRPGGAPRRHATSARTSSGITRS